MTRSPSTEFFAARRHEWADRRDRGEPYTRIADTEQVDTTRVMRVVAKHNQNPAACPICHPPPLMDDDTLITAENEQTFVRAGLTGRQFAALRRAGDGRSDWTVATIRAMPDEELLALPNVGPTLVRRIRQAIGYDDPARQALQTVAGLHYSDIIDTLARLTGFAEEHGGFGPAAAGKRLLAELGVHSDGDKQSA